MQPYTKPPTFIITQDGKAFHAGRTGQIVDKKA